MKLVHAADLHIDSPLRGLQRYQNAPVERIRGATRTAVVNLVDLCIEVDAAALLLAGDIFDGDWRDYSTGLFFAGEMARLKDAGIRVFSVRGNHDAASKMSRKLRLPDNVTELRTNKSETIIDEALGLAVHGQGFGRGVVDEDLAATFPAPCAGLFNIGLLHTSLDGRVGHDPYAPTSADMLASKGYDYWALGHVHTREVVRQDPWIVFSGNLQGRNARETGAKGATVVTVEDLRITDVAHRALDVVRWAHMELDASEHQHPDDICGALQDQLERCVEECDPRLVAARVTLVGQSAAHHGLTTDAERWESEMRSIANEVGDAWIEAIRFKTRAPVDLAALVAQDDALGALLGQLSARTSNPDLHREHVDALRELSLKLPREAREGIGGVQLNDSEYLTEALEDAMHLLVPQLVGTENS